VTEVLDVGEFLAGVEKSKLLSAEEVQRAREAAAGSRMDGATLARWLVDRGRLTQYQIDVIAGRESGDLRIGNYEVLGRLGAGGMGTVFKARHARMKRVVALKVLSASLIEDESFVKRFQREVETIARLSHPNIVLAYDADEAEAGPFLVMEFVQGRDLDSLVDEQGPLSIAAVVDYTLQAARGLAYAHAKGIIHRDVKPANLLLDSTGTIKLTDLGVARLTNSDGATSVSGITETGGVIGSVYFMSPEQALDSTSIDFRADIYSLGATLYYLLVGDAPYQGPNMMAVLLKHRDEPIPSLAAARPGLPGLVDTLFHRMVAKAPADRYQTMSEVVSVLEALKESLSSDFLEAPGDSALPAGTIAIRPTPGRSRGLEATVGPAPPALDSTHVQVASQGVEWSTLSVLLIEPSRVQSGIIRKYLQSQGIRNIAPVTTGREALQCVERDLPNVVISAFHLPDMSGPQLAEKIHASARENAPRFVLISTESEGADAGTLSKCGQTVLLHKPFSPEQLFEALRLVLDRSCLAGSASAGPATSRDRLRVLLVDDSTAARLHMKNVLTELGLTQIVEASDGAQAVASVARETFDLIVTDYNMPFMDGRGLVGYLKQNPATAHVPIIMVTTETDPAKLEAVRQLGITAICNKCFPRDEVSKILDGLVKSS
jgi:serine/threonine-protein kinase